VSREGPVVWVKCSSGNYCLDAKLTWWEICTRSVIVKLPSRAEAELQWQLDDRKKRYDDECQRYQETESRLSSRNRHGRG
jgi:hypothetical protein